MIGILRRTGPALVLAASLLLPSCQKYTEVRVESYPASGCSSLAVGNLNGGIAVHPVDGDSIVVRTTVTAWGRDAMEQVQVTFTPGSRALIQVVQPQGLINAASADLDISLPRGMVVNDLTTTNGDLVCTGLAIEGTLTSTNGDAVATGCTGIAGLSTTNGDVAASGGRLVVVMAGSTNGDVVIETNGLSADGSDYATTNGDVVATIPEGLGCVVEMDTTNGEVTVTGVEHSGELGEKSGRITVSGGGPVLTLSTTNGDIALLGRTAR